MIFIVGNSRSGTTMMSRVLGRNAAIHTFQEIHFFEAMTDTKNLGKLISKSDAINLLNKLIAIQTEGFYKQKNLDKYTNESRNIIEKIPHSSITPVKIYSIFLIYWTNLNHKNIPCEQTPKNIFYLNEINKNIDGASFINLVRDPRSVLLSQKNKWKRRYLGENSMPLIESLRSWTLYHPITIAKFWVSAIKQAENYKNDNLLTVKFEDIVNNPTLTIQKICKFINVKYHEEMINVPQVGSSLGNDNQDMKGIIPNKALTWKEEGLTRVELYWVEKIAKKELKRYGYEITNTNPSLIMLIYSLFTWPLKILGSLMLNLKRIKNIKEVFYKRFIN